MYQNYFYEFLHRYYHDELLDFQLKYPDVSSFYVDSIRLHNFNRELSEGLLQEPVSFLEEASQALQNCLRDYNVSVDHDEYPAAKVRFKSSAEIPRVSIRDIRMYHIHKFISIEGIIKRADPVIPQYLSVAFKCLRCEHVNIVPQMEDRLVKPSRCENESCERNGPYKRTPSESVLIDYQALFIQEFPESVPGSSQPQELKLEVMGDITGNIIPGCRVIVNGYVRERLRMKGKYETPDCEVSFVVNSIEYLEHDFEEITISPEDEEKILELSKDPFIKDKITASLTPSIYGLEKIKEAIVYQLFSGVTKNLPDGIRIRGDIHILIIGDPGTAKSQILKSVLRISPRAVFASGKGTSAAGLTAAAVQINSKWSLEAGALVIADKGIAIIDEIDKMSEEDRSAFHEAMEQQTITIAKAGMMTSFKSRCGILGAANPISGKFDLYDPTGHQIGMEPTLLSRFDFVLVIKDIADETADNNIAKHIMHTHRTGEKLASFNHSATPRYSKEQIESEMQVIKPQIDKDLLRKYIAYARRNVSPTMSPEAEEHFIEHYRNLRGSKESKSPVPITARNLEGLIRMGEASARIRLSDTVTLEDAKRVCKLSTECATELGSVHSNGPLDVEVINAHNNQKSQRDKIRAIKEFLSDKRSEYPKGIPIDVICEHMKEKEGIDPSTSNELIQKLRRSGDALMPFSGLIKLV